ncbi:MAG: cyclophilin-like fold protein [Candidatus Aenigmatarchaeota archaeon]
MEIRIEINGEGFEGKINENMNPETVEAITEELPLEGEAQKWGDEFFFEIPVNVEEENPKRYVTKGEIGYWPAGNAFCIFYGKTPGSLSEERIKPASPVNVIGEIENPEELKKFDEGVEIRVSETE